MTFLSIRVPSAIVLFAATALASSAGVAGAQTSHHRKFDRALESAVASASADLQPVIIRAKAGQLGAVRTWLKKHGNAIEGEQPGLNTIAAKVSAQQLVELDAL